MAPRRVILYESQSGQEARCSPSDQMGYWRMTHWSLNLMEGCVEQVSKIGQDDDYVAFLESQQRVRN